MRDAHGGPSALIAGLVIAAAFTVDWKRVEAPPRASDARVAALGRLLDPEIDLDAIDRRDSAPSGFLAFQEPVEWPEEFWNDPSASGRPRLATRTTFGWEYRRFRPDELAESEDEMFEPSSRTEYRFPTYEFLFQLDHLIGTPAY